MANCSPYRFREACARLPWLGALLEAYAILDAGIARAVAADSRNPACHSGCHACCLQPIPVSSLEVQGLRWFALTQLSGRPARLVGAALLLSPTGTGERCPFLVDGACSVYALRPMACREFVVFGRPCQSEEHVEALRPEDLLPLPEAAQSRAFAALLPHYGVVGPEAVATALRDRLILHDTRILRGHDWSSLAAALACK
ncbi:YkgJ family cysteine cluster protein [Desulfovibrio sp. TomC]|uniref:YkgJ family cysteine cluster protein n=1 Tax=Desulfovibrio sp. TomC TaxID=1562888 RepID=UPI000575716D|nr:YkgJ family cysteine cluster protein [Desulfovibrio sp. TomC]KHK00589.1 protein of unknown function UPF0153 [Desulfovibrio sp. TomC]